MNSVKMNFLSSEVLLNVTAMEKIYLIIDKVKDGDIVVLEGGLTPSEEAELIETTMREIDIENFRGIDIQTLEKNKPGFLGLSNKKRISLTIIGPANIMKEVKRQPNILSVVAGLDKS